MLTFILIAIVLICGVMLLFNVGAGAAILIILAVLALGIFLVSRYSKEKDEEFDETKGVDIEKNQNLYKQYCDDYKKQQSQYLGAGFEECWLSGSTSVYKTSDSRIVVATAVSPQSYKEDRISRKIIDATPGKFSVKHSFYINNVLYWQEKGNLQYTTDVSGGGVNVAGAVTGAFIAGEAGAIIGSREAITSKTNEHDSREIIVKMKDGSERSYTYDYRKAFVKLIPKKEYTFIQMNN